VGRDWDWEERQRSRRSDDGEKKGCAIRFIASLMLIIGIFVIEFLHPWS
jgi:hypothetical protein